MEKPLWMWIVFLGIVGFLLILDLGVLHRKSREIPARESIFLSLGYIAIGLLFGGWVWFTLGAESGEAYLTGFLIEKTLALDNIFLISLIFASVGVPRQYQYRVLFWGIFGVIALRAIMIGLGATIVSQFSWILYVFAVFLMITGVKMLLSVNKKTDIANSRVLQLLKRNMRFTEELHGDRFTVLLPADVSGGRVVRHFTPLALALIVIEFVDLIFAVDSVPAIFMITTDPYIVYTSNIFAILGLRALYFALDAIIHRFHYLKYALSLVLIFIGAKIFIADLLGLEKFPAAVSLGVTLALIVGGVVVSLVATRRTSATS